VHACCIVYRKACYYLICHLLHCIYSDPATWRSFNQKNKIKIKKNLQLNRLYIGCFWCSKIQSQREWSWTSCRSPPLHPGKAARFYFFCSGCSSFLAGILVVTYLYLTHIEIGPKVQCNMADMNKFSVTLLALHSATNMIMPSFMFVK
jgi:hypothetical protein